MTPPPRLRNINYSSRVYRENSSYENISSVYIAIQIKEQKRTLFDM